MIGERTNVTGSKKFARLILNEKYEEAIAVARDQVEAGANVIDIAIDPAVSTNPYFEFDVKVDAAGEFVFTWYDDDGSVYETSKKIIEMPKI